MIHFEQRQTDRQRDRQRAKKGRDRITNLFSTLRKQCNIVVYMISRITKQNQRQTEPQTNEKCAHTSRDRAI